MPNGSDSVVVIIGKMCWRCLTEWMPSKVIKVDRCARSSRTMAGCLEAC